MREFAILDEISENAQTGEKEFFVLPMIVSSCVDCKTGCAKRGKPFRAKNSRGLELNVGDAVRLGLPKIALALNGLLSFLVPIACAVAGFFLAPYIGERVFPLEFVRSHAEEMRAGGVVFFLLASSSVVFVISRSNLHFMVPEILHTV